MVLPIDNTQWPPCLSGEHTSLTFLCPSCEHALEYIGTVTRPAPSEPIDYFRCPVGCGTFEHERRTHRMRQVE
jgi:hypothetical protein